jgi:outer membrane protein OmpA-like peptidoglycan-associated protein
MRPSTRISICLLIATLAGMAEASRYGATLHESTWSVSSSRVECSLVHEVPHFGEARFAWEAGGQLGLAVAGKLRLPAGSRLQVDIVPPAWRHDRPSKQIVSLLIEKTQRNLVLEGALAQRVFDELSEGMVVAFNYPDPVNERAKVEVSLSPVQFQRPLKEFKACVGKLLPVDYRKAGKSRVFFSNNSAKLSPDAQGFLDDMAEYLKTAKRVYGVRIEGHADSRGRSGYNYDLGSRRAKEVRNWLVNRGVPANKFLLRSYGERRPTACREYKGDKRDNRCAVIVLKRR